ncbi:MAG: DUF2508 family protein [Bacillota bacterium]|nr:DUF2508 family protein [Bacillota bacterium]
MASGQLERLNLLAEIRGWLGIPRDKKPLVPPEVHALEQAHTELVCAVAYFDCVTEPELVDHAVYMLGAAQKKYSYLLSKAKENNIRVSGLDCLFREDGKTDAPVQNEPSAGE